MRYFQCYKGPVIIYGRGGGGSGSKVGGGHRIYFEAFNYQKWGPSGVFSP